MGSQTFDILRQGVWASITGGWFYDPRQDVFCNAVHLYLWLFFLCTPFLTHLYFQRIATSWAIYSGLNVCLMGFLKGINMALHALYDRSQENAGDVSKKSFSRESDCGAIEMQVLGFENVHTPSQLNPYESSTVNSVVSFDCTENNAETIDFKVEVHRKNSSVSNESVMDQIDDGAKNERFSTPQHQFNNNDEDNIENNACVQYCYTSSNVINRKHHDNMAMEQNNDASGQFVNKLGRKNSLDISEVQSDHQINNYANNDKSQTSYYNTPIFQRHSSSDNPGSNENESISSNSFNDNNRTKILNRDTQLYSESSHAKSDLGIENLEENCSKFLLEPRKGNNSINSVLQSPLELTISNQARKRRHSNTGSKVCTYGLSGVRRIKSTALEISSHQPSVSNLYLHPNSAETISGKQVKTQSTIFPPPSKCLVRNAHFNLCPDISSLSGIDSVYPIVEQCDEKHAAGLAESDKNGPKNLCSNGDQRSSITESETDLDRPHCRSTDSEINSSSSPLLHKSVSDGQYKIDRLCQALSANNARSNKECVIWSRNKSSDSGCPASDAELVDESSKDTFPANHSRYQQKAGNHLDRSSSYQKNVRKLGAIPKTSRRSEDACIERENMKLTKQNSLNCDSPSMSLRSFSCENFDGDVCRPYKDQWLVIGHSKRGHTISSNILAVSNDAANANVLSKGGVITESNYKMTPVLTRSNAIKRPKKSDDYTKDTGDVANKLESEVDDADNIQYTTVSDFVPRLYKDQAAIQRPEGTILTFKREDFNESGYCDYWRPRHASVEKHVPEKRYYTYRIKSFGGKNVKIKMDRLQLLALFDRDLSWIHVLLSVMLSFFICFLGSSILTLEIYKDFCVFLFCLIIAGSQYSLLKSVQPDASSPVHGFNKTVAYSRPVYFCLFSGLLVLTHHGLTQMKDNEFWNKAQSIYGISIVPMILLQVFKDCISMLLLLFPILFSLGMFPQFNTFCMYAFEQIDMHIFGGTAVCSLAASIYSVFKSCLTVCIIYGPLYGSLAEKKSSQNVWFSIFCAILISLCYHLSRCSSDFSHIWALVKASIFNYADDSEYIQKSNSDFNTDEKSTETKNESTAASDKHPKKRESIVGNSTHSVDSEQSDLLQQEIQNTINSRLQNDLVVCSVVAIFTFSLHSTTVFTVLQPDLNKILFGVTGVLGFFVHYLLPQMRKHLPWLCFAHPILKQREFGRFEVGGASKIMWFEKIYVYLCFIEKNILYPLIFVSTLTADSPTLVNKFGQPFGTLVIAVCAIKGVRSAYSDSSNQYLILSFCVLLFQFDFGFASETFLVDYFIISTIYRKCCDFLLKIQFVITYIAPWQITWGSAFHAFAQPFSVPHSAMLFLQMVLSAILSTPLNPFLGSAIFLTSYARPIKFWERDYNTRRIDHSNTRLSSHLEKDLGADDNNLNSIFYEHLTKSLQHSLCGDLLLGRWGNVNQGDCFVLASDYLNCLVHIIELGNGLCTFQMRGLEFRGTYCQQREVEAISEGIENNDGCCCCSPGHLPNMLSANAMFSTRWLAWQVVAAQYVLEGYSISENLATATLQLFEFRKVLITYYIKSIIYYVTQSHKLEEWLSSTPIQEALDSTLNRQFVDLDPIFNYNLDEDFDFRAVGITRSSFCCVYLNWIQFCFSKRMASRHSGDNLKTKDCADKNIQASLGSSQQGMDEKELGKQCGKEETFESNQNYSETFLNDCIITQHSQLVSLCLALGLLARRSLATASHGSLSSVESFLHGLHALFKGDFRITSPRDEWVFADMELLHGVVAPAVKMGLKLHQDHFSSPDEYMDPVILYTAIKTHNQELVISHEADPAWRNAVLKGTPNLLALRHVMEDGSDEYRIVRLTKRFLTFRVIKLNRECVRGLWAGQQQELVYLRNRNPERGSIQNAKQALRNIINSSCDQPIGYPIYVSSLTTSYAETNEQLCELIGGSITLDAVQFFLETYWKRIKQRFHEGCSSGSAVLETDTPNELPGSYYLSNSTPNFTMSCGSQTLPSSSIRGSVASVNKPTNPSSLVGFLSREREQEREFMRDRSNKKVLTKSNDKPDREKLFLSTNLSADTLANSTSLADTSKKVISCPGHGSYTLKITSSTSGQVVENLRHTFDIPQENILVTDFCDSSDHVLLEVNKKVIIVDGTEIYDCLDLGRRIDVVWPNEEMRSNGGRSSWKDWCPREGMIGFVVHYWQPNHPDLRFRSNVNRTLYLVAIGNRFVPVGERGIKEYKQISLDLKITRNLSQNNTESEPSTIQLNSSKTDNAECSVNNLNCGDEFSFFQ